MDKAPLTAADLDWGMDCNLEDPSDDEAHAFERGVRFAEWKHGIGRSSGNTVLPPVEGQSVTLTKVAQVHDEAIYTASGPLAGDPNAVMAALCKSLTDDGYCPQCEDVRMCGTGRCVTGKRK